MWFMDLSAHAVWPENLRQLHMCQSLSYNPELTYSFSPLKTYFSKNLSRLFSLPISKIIPILFLLFLVF